MRYLKIYSIPMEQTEKEVREAVEQELHAEVWVTLRWPLTNTVEPFLYYIMYEVRSKLGVSMSVV